MVFTFHFIGLSQAFVDPSQVPPLLLSVSSFCGGIGTNVLLLLSGFLVGKAESDLGRSYLQMLAKRAIRIYPAYAILVCAGLIAGMASPTYSKMGSLQSTLESFFQQLILIPGLFPSRPAMTVSWTLSFIFAGYVILPLLARIYRLIFKNRFSLVWLWLVVLLAILAANYFLSLGYTRIAYIPAGCMIAEATLKKNIGFRGSLAFWQGAVGCFFLLAARFEIHQIKNPSSYHSLLFSLSGIGAVSGIVLLLFSADAALGKQLNNFAFRLVIWIGKRGYSLYLIHGSVIKLALVGASALFPVQPWGILWLIPLYACIFCLALGTATVSYILLEKNLSSWLMRRLQVA